MTDALIRCEPVVVRQPRYGMRQFFVYVLSSHSRRLYVGVTNLAASNTRPWVHGPVSHLSARSLREYGERHFGHRPRKADQRLETRKEILLDRNDESVLDRPR